MAELKFVQYLLDEEKLILQIMEKFQSQVNKLRVEEMNLLSALRDKQFEETIAERPVQEEELAAVDLTGSKAGVEDDEEPTNSELIDLRVGSILSTPMDISSEPRDISEEEEEDET
ncbi:snRNA-activating protein complex subunit 5-like [Dermacentor albipictus]|uniref:snRNA-activating protein complex subunit 5-like n=1 Tax=Dermacentor albipictus TaxID=60249 RepID=UPI0031FBEC3A